MDKVRIAGRIITVGLLLWAGGCGPSRPPLPPPGHPKPYCIGNTWYQPIPDASGFKQRGLASWYGKKFHGRKTANGEVYDMHAMTAAHKTLPLGTCVKVRNMENGRSVEVRINDRGPFITGRVIDLSYAGAKAIGLVGPGVAQVEVVALGKPVSTPKGKRVYAPVDYRRGAFTVQVGAFQERSNAERLRKYSAVLTATPTSRPTTTESAPITGFGSDGLPRWRMQFHSSGPSCRAGTKRR